MNLKFVFQKIFHEARRNFLNNKTLKKNLDIGVNLIH